MKKQEILILVPGPNARGGITSYYQALNNKFSSNITFLERGSRRYPDRSSILNQIYRMFSDYFRFIFKIIGNRYHLIFINMTLDRRGLYRDAVYVLLSFILRKKNILFIHGWDENFVSTMSRLSIMFRNILFKSDLIIVLGSRFRNELISWDCKKKIVVESTIIDNEIANKRLSHKNENRNTFSILYLARVEKDKGIYIVLKAFQILKEKYPDVYLTIVGDGTELENIRHYVQKNSLEDVKIRGYVQRDHIYEYLNEADIYFFPTYYKEGLPTSILEAMAFGLPVLTRPVGGIPDVFKDNVNGVLTDSLDPAFFASKISYLIDDRIKRRQIGQNNIEHSKKYMASEAVKRLESYFSEVIKK